MLTWEAVGPADGAALGPTRVKGKWAPVDAWILHSLGRRLPPGADTVYPAAAMARLLGLSGLDRWAATISNQNG